METVYIDRIGFFILLILLKGSVHTATAEDTVSEGELPAYILSEVYIKFFKMKYLISLKEFVLYDKRNYNKLIHHPDPRCNNRRRKFSRLFC